MESNQTDVDQNLRVEVLARLMTDNRTRNAALRVGVLNGIAHLAGMAKSVEARSAAEEVAWQVGGVRGVVNRIQAPGAPDPARTINIKL